MRYLIYILTISFLFSCSNKTPERNYDSVSKNIYVELDNMKETTINTIISEKLQNYIELLKLHATHPNFKKDIKLQLKELSKDSIIKINDIKNAVITDIGISDIQRISKEVEKIKVVYTTENQEKKSEQIIYAYLTTSIIKVNNLETSSFKIKFSLQ